MGGCFDSAGFIVAQKGSGITQIGWHVAQWTIQRLWPSDWGFCWNPTRVVKQKIRYKTMQQNMPWFHVTLLKHRSNFSPVFFTFFFSVNPKRATQKWPSRHFAQPILVVDSASRALSLNLQCRDFWCQVSGRVVTNVGWDIGRYRFDNLSKTSVVCLSIINRGYKVNIYVHMIHIYKQSKQI